MNDFHAAIRSVDQDGRFRATVYAINTLLIEKGVYTTEEFERYFCEYVDSHRKPETESQIAIDYLRGSK